MENTFKRDVFWSGVKLLLGATLSTLYNLPFIFLFYAYVFPNYWLALLYYLTVPAISGIYTYVQINKFKDLRKFSHAKESNLKQFVEARQKLLAEIQTIGLN